MKICDGPPKASPAVTRSRSSALTRHNPVLPFCPFPYLSGVWEENRVKYFSIEIMTLHDVVIGKDVQVLVEACNKKLRFKMYHSDYFYDVEKRYPNASKNWSKKMTSNHPKTKAMKDCVDGLFQSKFFHNDDRIYCEFVIDLPFPCKQDFSAYHGEDCGCSMLWSKSSNKVDKNKKQFTKSVLVDLEAIEQIRTRRTYKQQINIETSSNEGSVSSSDSSISSSDSEASMSLDSKSMNKKSRKSRKEKLKTSAKKKKLEDARKRQEIEAELKKQRNQMQELLNQERLFNEQRRIEMERKMREEREENLRKVYEERERNEEQMRNLQGWITNFQQQTQINGQQGQSFEQQQQTEMNPYGQQQQNIVPPRYDSSSLSSQFNEE